MWGITGKFKTVRSSPIVGDAFLRQFGAIQANLRQFEAIWDNSRRFKTIWGNFAKFMTIYDNLTDLDAFSPQAI